MFPQRIVHAGEPFSPLSTLQDISSRSKFARTLDLIEIKDLLRRGDPAFWTLLGQLTAQATAFDDLLFLSTLRRKAIARGFNSTAKAGQPLRVALLGGCSLYPLHEILVHLLAADGLTCEIHLGDYDNYISELSSAGGTLDQFKPDVIFLIPGEQRCKYPGALTDNRVEVEAAANATATQLIELCRGAHERTAAEIVLCNFMLPARRDLGELRARTPASDWNFRKCVNLELGLGVPPFVRICDLEYLAYRIGAIAAEDSRGWFESKQLFSPAMLVEVCREVAHLIRGMRVPQKKVLILDLDNTLWGGVVADDGLEGIEIGDTSPRGEAFKAFQKCIASMKHRGILLAVCSKNDHARAIEPFEKHPEMVLRTTDFVSFKANWAPEVGQHPGNGGGIKPRHRQLCVRR